MLKRPSRTQVQGQCDPWSNEEEAQARQLSYALVERQQKVYKVRSPCMHSLGYFLAYATYV
jgi:hypothetical protein